VLGAIVLVLLVLTLWDDRRIASAPLRPNVLTASPPAGAAISASDPGLADTLARLGASLARRDGRALARLADPGGIVVAAFVGGLPESGAVELDAQRLSSDALTGAQVTVRGWRNDGRGRVIVLTEGWPRKQLRLGPRGTVDLTPLAAFGLISQSGTWYWRWLLTDSTSALSQQARSLVWQPVAPF
jgi:hypothetical protein